MSASGTGPATEASRLPPKTGAPSCGRPLRRRPGHLHAVGARRCGRAATGRAPAPARPPSPPAVFQRRSTSRRQNARPTVTQPPPPAASSTSVEPLQHLGGGGRRRRRPAPPAGPARCASARAARRRRTGRSAVPSMQPPRSSHRRAARQPAERAQRCRPGSTSGRRRRSRPRRAGQIAQAQRGQRAGRTPRAPSLNWTSASFRSPSRQGALAPARRGGPGTGPARRRPAPGRRTPPAAGRRPSRGSPRSSWMSRYALPPSSTTRGLQPAGPAAQQHAAARHLPARADVPRLRRHAAPRPPPDPAAPRWRWSTRSGSTATSSGPAAGAAAGVRPTSTVGTRTIGVSSASRAAHRPPASNADERSTARNMHRPAVQCTAACPAQVACVGAAGSS